MSLKRMLPPLSAFVILLSAVTLATAQVDPQKLFQEYQLQDVAGKPVFPPGDRPLTAVFQPGQKNLLIIHGFNSSPSDHCTKDLTHAIGGLYDNVLLFQYPSGQPIRQSAKWLHDHLSLLTAHPGIRFDIIGYSEGGLVARAAKEPSLFINGNRAFGDRVENLVTIGTPHKGILNPFVLGTNMGVPAVSDQLLRQHGGSGFLELLNDDGPDNPMVARQGRTRYMTIAGRVLGESDGIVGVQNAHGLKVTRDPREGVLLTPPQGRTTLRLKHSHSCSGDSRGMPCDYLVYEQLAQWLFNKKGAFGTENCVNLAGEWSVSEQGTVTCTAEGETETEEISNTAQISLVQQDCRIRFTIPGIDVERAGEVTNGTSIRLSGRFLIPLEGNVQFSVNRYEAVGTYECGKLVLKGEGIAVGIADGVRFRCTGRSVAECTRPER
jgi:pimeloyl-ACP methyl ester carboxylesterase